MGLLDRFSKKPKLYVSIIDETGRVSVVRRPIENNVITLKDDGVEKSYIVNKSYVYFVGKKQLPTAFYWRNNPAPLNLGHRPADTENPNNPVPDAENLRTILESKVIQELFKDESGREFLLLILIGANLALTLLLLLSAMGVLKLGTSGG
jgi:hypothetical protein